MCAATAMTALARALGEVEPCEGRLGAWTRPFRRRSLPRSSAAGGRSEPSRAPTARAGQNRALAAGAQTLIGRIRRPARGPRRRVGVDDAEAAAADVDRARLEARHRDALRGRPAFRLAARGEGHVRAAPYPRADGEEGTSLRRGTDILTSTSSSETCPRGRNAGGVSAGRPRPGHRPAPARRRSLCAHGPGVAQFVYALKAVSEARDSSSCVLVPRAISTLE